MHRNLGTADRGIRIVIGAALLSLVVFGPRGGWGLIGLVGLWPLVPGLIGYCPPYALFGFDTLSGGFRRTREFVDPARRS